VTSLNRVDIARFEFDFDTTWCAFFTDAKKRIYSRYGGRDEHEPESRMSKASLLQTMREVLDAHRTAVAQTNRGEPAASASGFERNTTQNPRTNARNSPNVVGSLFHPEPKSSATPYDLPLMRKNHQGCVHCHQLKEYSLLQAYYDGRFRRESLFQFPYPEALGIEIDRQHGHRASAVRSESAANAAGLQAGDVIVQAGDVPIRSELDLRWALHSVPLDTMKLKLLVGRIANPSQPQLIPIELTLPTKWRQSEISWRKSMRSVPVDWGFRAAELSKSERREAKRPTTGLAIHVFSVKPRGFAAALGLQKGDVIIAAEGNTRERTLAQLRSDLLRRFDPGDELHLTVKRDDETIELIGRFPDWFTDETSVP
jgi:serine protease Do